MSRRSASSSVTVSGVIDLRSEAVFGFSVAFLEHLGHVRAVAAGAQRDRAAGLGIDAELVLLVSLREDLLGAFGRQLVRRDVGRQRLAVVAALEVRAVLADADDDVGARQRRRC